jgi:putative spermidine/putrescine transport system ATP-binding protein
MTGDRPSSDLTYRGVRKTFGATVALESLDLVLRPGELVSLLGPSGCGKTTALRVAAGFEKADAGTVSVGGVDLTGRPAHQRNMGMVFQSYSLFPNLSVAENVEFGLRTRKVDRPARARRVAEMLELVQLTRLAQRYPHQISGGQQQRVALARALAVQPEVLLLDEPLSALDAKVRATLRDEIRRIQTELGITTLFVTHDQEEALAISDRVGVMSNGHLEQIGAPVDVYRHPTTAFVARFVGSMNELPGAVGAAGSVRVNGVSLAVPKASGLSAGADVVLLVRPEDLSLSGPADGGGRSGFPGTVTASTFQGASTVVTIRLDGLDRLVSVHESGVGSSVAPGARVTVLVDAARAVCEAA